MPVEEVEALVATEALRYPEIDDFYEGLGKTIASNRVPTSRFIPHPVTKQMVQLGKSYYRTPDGQLFGYMESPSPEFLARRRHNPVLASFSPTEIRNYVVQGSGCTWMKAAMWLLVRAFYARRNFGGKALIINTVHDASYIDAHNDVAFEAGALLHACMEAASEQIEFTFGWNVPVPVPSETGWGPNMLEEAHIPGVHERAAEYRKELRMTYMKGYVPTFERNTNG